MDFVVAPMRPAMNRSVSGGMALSCSDTRYHGGLLLQPMAVALPVSAAGDSGRWVANITSATSIGTSAHRHRRFPESVLW
jgi:hypothetical protein